MVKKNDKQLKQALQASIGPGNESRQQPMKGVVALPDDTLQLNKPKDCLVSGFSVIASLDSSLTKGEQLKIKKERRAARAQKQALKTVDSIMVTIEAAAPAETAIDGSPTSKGSQAPVAGRAAATRGRGHSKEYALGGQSLYSVGPSAVEKSKNENSHLRPQEVHVADQNFSIASSSKASGLVMVPRRCKDTEGSEPAGEADLTKSPPVTGSVNYSKKNTIKRFSTLRDKSQQKSSLQAAKVVRVAEEHVNDVEEQESHRKHRIKRVKTQKGGEAGRGFPAESSDNGMTLCKISESGIEQLSIVESDDLYGAEEVNEAARAYDQKIKDRIAEGRKFVNARQGGSCTPPRKTPPRRAETSSFDNQGEHSPRRDRHTGRRGPANVIQSNNTAQPIRAAKSKSKNSLFQSFGKSSYLRAAEVMADYSDQKRRSNSKKRFQNLVVPGLHMRADLARPQLRPEANTKQRVFFRKYLQVKKRSNRLGDLLSIGTSSEYPNFDGSESAFSRSYARGRAKQQKHSPLTSHRSKTGSQKAAADRPFVKKSNANAVFVPGFEGTRSTVSPASKNSKSESRASLPQSKEGARAPKGKLKVPRIPNMSQQQKRQRAISRELPRVVEQPNDDCSPAKNQVGNDSFSLQISVLKKKQTSSFNEETFSPEQTLADVAGALDKTTIKKTIVDYENSQEGEEGKIYLEDQFEKSECNDRESVGRQGPSFSNNRGTADTKIEDNRSQNFEDSLIEQSQGEVDENDNRSAQVTITSEPANRGAVLSNYHNIKKTSLFIPSQFDVTSLDEGRQAKINQARLTNSSIQSRSQYNKKVPNMQRPQAAVNNDNWSPPRLDHSIKINVMDEVSMRIQEHSSHYNYRDKSRGMSLGSENERHQAAVALAQQVVDIQSEFMQSKLSQEFAQKQSSHRSRQNLFGPTGGKSRGSTRQQHAAGVNRLEKEPSFSSLKRRNARQTHMGFGVNYVVTGTSKPHAVARRRGSHARHELPVKQTLSTSKRPPVTQMNRRMNEDGSAQYQFSAAKTPGETQYRKQHTHGNNPIREELAKNNAQQNLTSDGWAPRSQVENYGASGGPDLMASGLKQQQVAWFAASHEPPSQGSSPIKTTPSKSISPNKPALGVPYSKPADPNKFVKDKKRRQMFEPVLNEKLRGGPSNLQLRRSLASQGPLNNSTPQVQVEEPETAFLGPKNGQSTQSLRTSKPGGQQNSVAKLQKDNSYTASVDENFEQKFTSHNSSKREFNGEAEKTKMEQIKQDAAEISILLANHGAKAQANASRQATTSFQPGHESSPSKGSDGRKFVPNHKQYLYKNMLINQNQTNQVSGSTESINARAAATTTENAYSLATSGAALPTLQDLQSHPVAVRPVALQAQGPRGGRSAQQKQRTAFAPAQDQEPMSAAMPALKRKFVPPHSKQSPIAAMTLPAGEPVPRRVTNTVETDTSPRHDGVMRVIRSYCYRGQGAEPKVAQMKLRLNGHRSSGKNNSAGGRQSFMTGTSKERKQPDSIRVYVPQGNIRDAAAVANYVPSKQRQFFQQSDLFSGQILDPALSGMLDRSGDKRAALTQGEVGSPKKSISSVMHGSDLGNRYVKSSAVPHEADSDVYQMNQQIIQSYPQARSSPQSQARARGGPPANRLMRLRQTPQKYDGGAPPRTATGNRDTVVQSRFQHAQPTADDSLEPMATRTTIMNRRNAEAKKTDREPASGSNSSTSKFLQPLLSHQRNVTGARLKDFNGARSGAARGASGMNVSYNMDLPQNLFIAHAPPATEVNWAHNFSYDLNGSISNIHLNSHEKLDNRKQHSKTRAGGERSKIHMPMIDTGINVSKKAGDHSLVKSQRSGRSNIRNTTNV